MSRTPWLLAGVLLLGPGLPAGAQVARPQGYASIVADTFPGLDASELRARLFAEEKIDAGRLRITLAALVEGGLRAAEEESSTSAVFDPLEVSAEWTWPRADLRVGYSRVVWGRLDEFQPSDVVNPQDLTRFFFEGRVESRLPVAMVRARWLPADQVAIEGIVAPLFRAGSFDRLDERTAPLDLIPPQLSVVDPGAAWANVSGGGRLSVTSGRVDWSVSTYRGFDPFPSLVSSPFPTQAPGLLPVGEYRRFTMLGGDFETVRGAAGLRGEVAAFLDRRIEGGIGLDRRAGTYRLAGNVMVSHDVEHDRTSTTMVAVADRSFARETRSLRLLGVYNPVDDAAFARVVGRLSLRDNVTLEASGGLFSGSATTAPDHGVSSLALLEQRDFAYLRLKVFY